ncbi:hypothetical protein M4914_02100 [Streptomyces somaliensis DSM 40738]|uniref:Uncharacterized protein n=1 Tax=Streptomyces somaliensis (strain ATCC 33201 / DSM 40738 / JCM 12659 / KCTC 9044 / NCTC 11332 / NRRL B-12077 / IP 733) TaxID=1134445 RepID=A0AA44DFW2_STRE0|nr:hypothetical protein [Streptomyces somaliensis]MCQ0021875.1 hypothetical protein [Streptomyces somaliensis DSM 40738]NKY15693.1 hypothetical protein [Streptomyces somaliensis DSM 40738]
MAHPTDITALRHALRREAPATLGILADAEDFAAMRRYRTFTFDDHPTYLREAERLLRALAAGGTHTTVTLFDPEEYAAYCAETGLDPDTRASRTRYTAEIAASGVRVPYTGQPLDELVPLLVKAAVRHATREYAALLLDDAGQCADCGQDIGRAAYEQASRAVLRILDEAGPGAHQLVCSVPAADERLLAVLRTDRTALEPARLDSPEGTEFLTVLAAGLARATPGGLVLRTSTPGTPDRLHGWRLDHGRLVPLTEAEVFNAYCTDADTGEPLPPEPGVEYRAGFDLAPDDGRSTHH